MIFQVPFNQTILCFYEDWHNVSLDMLKTADIVLINLHNKLAYFTNIFYRQFIWQSSNTGLTNVYSFHTVDLITVVLYCLIQGIFRNKAI